MAAFGAVSLAHARNSASGESHREMRHMQDARHIQRQFCRQMRAFNGAEVFGLTASWCGVSRSASHRPIVTTQKLRFRPWDFPLASGKADARRCPLADTAPGHLPLHAARPERAGSPFCRTGSAGLAAGGPDRLSGRVPSWSGSRVQCRASEDWLNRRSSCVQILQSVPDVLMSDGMGTCPGGNARAAGHGTAAVHHPWPATGAKPLT